MYQKKKKEKRKRKKKKKNSLYQMNYSTYQPTHIYVYVDWQVFSFFCYFENISHDDIQENIGHRESQFSV